MKPATLKLLHKQYILLDTNILIDAVKHSDAYQVLFDDLNQAEAWSVLDPVVNIEFLRGVKKSDAVVMKNFLSQLFGKDILELNVSEETFKTAQNIAQICSLSENKNIKLGDCLIAAQIQKYGSGNRTTKLYLATQNHKDFPACLFNRIDVEIIPLEDGSIKTVGIYELDAENYTQLVRDFL